MSADSAPAVVNSAPLSTRQINKRILSIVIFTFVCYLTIGLPLAVLPSFVHNHLGYSSLLAGLVISAQYFATLISRPHAGRYADLLGPKKVVLFGLSCCGISGIFCGLAFWSDNLPLISVLMLVIGRFFLGVGESFASTGSTLWGMGVVGSIHTARVISWNGVATYGAMAIGAPLGVYLNLHWGLAGIAWFICLVVLLVLVLASRKATVSVVTGKRIAFRAVLGKIWLYGLGLGFGTVGFGVIATFITLFYADKGWDGAAFSLTLFSVAFVGIRLLFSNSISSHGGLKVTAVSFLIEIVGLLLIWGAGAPWMVQVGAFLAGAGFSLVFPALGVEAVKQVEPQNQGTALGTYSAFLDLGLGITGPLAGVAIGQFGIPAIYLGAALIVAFGVLLTLRLLQQQQRRDNAVRFDGV